MIERWLKRRRDAARKASEISWAQAQAEAGRKAKAEEGERKKQLDLQNTYEHKVLPGIDESGRTFLENEVPKTFRDIADEAKKLIDRESGVTTSTYQQFDLVIDGVPLSELPIESRVSLWRDGKINSRSIQGCTIRHYYKDEHQSTRSSSKIQVVHYDIAFRFERGGVVSWKAGKQVEFDRHTGSYHQLAENIAEAIDSHYYYWSEEKYPEFEPSREKPIEDGNHGIGPF